MSLTLNPSSNGPAAPLVRPVLSAEEFLALRRPRGDREILLDGEPFWLTSLDKPYWPAEGITKAELLQYYLRVTPVLLPLLEGRPAVLNRYPHGTSGGAFYQHRVEGGPSFLTRVVLPH